jgi:hypothetical protein
MEYFLCIADTRRNFIEEVNKYLANGWQLHGVTFVQDTYIYQALIKVAVESNE